MPLHQEGLELLLLLRRQMPQLRVLGQDTLELRPDLAHHRPWHLPQETWGESGRARRWPNFVLNGALEPWGLWLPWQGPCHPLAWLLWGPRCRHHGLCWACPTAQGLFCHPSRVPVLLGQLRVDSPRALQRRGQEGTWLPGGCPHNTRLWGAQEELLALP